MQHTKLRYEAALFTNALIWGGTFVIIKSALAGISPMVFVSLRFVIATLLFLPFVYRLIPQQNKSQVVKSSILGLYLFIGFATQTIGLIYTTATKSAFITGLFVIFTPILQTIKDRKIPSVQSLIAILLATIGIIFLSSKGTSFFDILFEVGNSFNIGDFLTLICAVFYAVYIIYLDEISGDVDTKFLTFFQILVTGVLSIICIPLFAATGLETIRFSLKTEVLLAIVYTSLFATVLTTYLQTRFQKYVTPTRASIIFSMEPIFAGIFAFFILNEKMSIFGIVGSAFILTGILVSELLNKDKK